MTRKPAQQYLLLVEELGELGYTQYEISNFARPGRESRHNLLYWRGEEYLGFGPGAHSFFGGRRFYYPRDLEGFLQGNAPVDDGPSRELWGVCHAEPAADPGLAGRQDCLARFGLAGTFPV